MIGLIGLCMTFGYGISRDPVLVWTILAMFLGVLLLVLAGAEWFTTLTLAALPWLVVFSDVAPPLTLTLASAFAVLLLVARTPLRPDIISIPWIGVFLFILLLLAHVAESTASGQFIEAAKLVLFPAMVLVVSSQTARDRLVAMRPILLGSAVGAMATQAATLVLNIGPSGNYYKSGTYHKTGVQLGLTPDTPHEMALLGVIVAVACLVTIRDIRWRIATAAVAATPALATGIRSALVALALTLLMLVIKTRLRPSVVLSIISIAAIVIYSGAASVIVARYQHGQAAGEYSNLQAAGSGRGAIETTALGQWGVSGFSGIVFGTGLAAIRQIEQQKLGEAVGAQNDVVAIVVELGVIGLFGWFLIWFAIIRAKANWLVLVPIASYALTNGVMQYVGAIVFGIVMAVACSSLDGAKVGSKSVLANVKYLGGTSTRSAYTT